MLHLFVAPYLYKTLHALKPACSLARMLANTYAQRMGATQGGAATVMGSTQPLLSCLLLSDGGKAQYACQLVCLAIVCCCLHKS